ncbi:L-serine dehydratase, iron-sulfur-dependent, single chain form [Corynebacterium camporealensis]|uniref:L-serine dehydratase n=2 Tax=Corynebacterium camporealensis TaxID=161896 RepID=A0A0F6TAS0_9CORY|nr:L-serine ammonia-lyase [Corynebacterium camporealensis]AKE39269.1 L-serine dehydratase, iron-sulfur-dependent, single chain form [Corynebacterium camporealensis]AVH88451.1 L-serine dehydratase, iron-sulfur-dependent, single chain form [Corynebacterium camporealensis]
MTISVTDIFSIGIGPSSSHTVGPMRAAKAFCESLPEFPARVHTELRGSLSATGRGHATDRAVILGLAGWEPLTVPVDAEPNPNLPIPSTGHISGPAGEVDFEIEFNNQPVPEHPNCVIFSAWDAEGNELATNAEYFSVGGGFILSREQLDAEMKQSQEVPAGAAAAQVEDLVPYDFETGEQLLHQCAAHDKEIWEIVLANEAALHRNDGGEEAVLKHLDLVWDIMRECVTDGISTKGLLPGGLRVPRRAPQMYQQLLTKQEDPYCGFSAMEWVNLYALAVNEQNAAGGRVITAPTNGACGIIPAVLHYARDFQSHFTRESARRYLLTAGAVGMIIKQNASISGAEVGCQGEVGSASSMAAAGMAALLGGTPAQIENAAEIALEHNLGLTCDPVGGLVQIPCIERNAIGAVKSINAARMALMGEGTHHVTLDNAVQTMAETGRDMLSKYKETSIGGLAKTMGFSVSQVEC